MAPSKAKDPNAPKKPLSGYFLWLQENRERLTKEVGTKEVLKAAGEEWQAMTQKEKDAWKKRSVEDKVRYEKEMTAYRSTKRAK